MQSRTRTLLTFSLVCLLPLLVISIFSFLGNLQLSQRLLQTAVKEGVWKQYVESHSVLRQQHRQLQDLASGASMRDFVKLTAPTEGETAPVKETVSRLLRSPSAFAVIAGLSADKRTVFIGESQGSDQVEPSFRIHDLSTQRIDTPEEMWTTTKPDAVCDTVNRPALGTMLRCATPIFDRDKPVAIGVLVAYLKIDSLIPSLAQNSGLRSFSLSHEPIVERQVMVLGDSGQIVGHTNDALKHQQVDSAAPYLSSVAQVMNSNESGSLYYESSNGDTWLMAYARLMPKLSLGVAQNYSAATQPVRVMGWITIVLAILLGVVATFLLSTYFLKKTRSIDRVAAGVGAIAHGDLNHQIDLLSRDDLRPMADNLALVTAQMRDQIARETESRQLQAFVRLTATLTHDLKNSIGALSLTVSNMERHFEHPEFRADAMKTLTTATDNLKSLVARLSNPTATLSGEHKRPRPVNLVPMLRRVVSLTAEQAPEDHAIHISLPDSLTAMVDAERIEKVAENLVINALEAMAGKKGVLKITASPARDGKVSFTVSDTGTGMSQQYINEKLFHAFATTKKRGVGLGLYTCREVVRAHGGTIEVESAQGVGTTFRVVLPSAEITSGERKSSPTPG